MGEFSSISPRSAANWSPEVLAPVGAPECLPAAVAGGAHAVYLGLRHFNARGRAENFRKAELPGHVAYLHRHGLKCYLVMNTLVHDDEFVKALDLAACAHDAGVDAVIVQDLGLWRALTRELPNLKRHASTQMTVHDPAQVAVLAELGAERVILARELSLAEVAACTDAARAHGIETEHFVHGALCYAFSGQCLMSNFAGCRSANRGTCAQNCRFDYLEAKSGTQKDQAATDPETLISMKDLALIGSIGALADAGVASLKIEGRLKGPDYVYTTSRVYRAAVDAWRAKKPFDLKWARELLKDVFARSHTDAPLAGDYSAASRLHRYEPEQDRTPDAQLLSSDRARGEAVISSVSPVRAGQGFGFAVGFFTGGFLVLSADRVGGAWHARIRIADRGPALPAGLALFRNADHERKREALTAMAAVPFSADDAPAVAVTLNVHGRAEAMLSVTANTDDGRSATVLGRTPLRPAANAPLSAELIADKLGAFGGTGFRLASVGVDLAGSLFAPAAELKQLRRELVDALSAQTPVETTTSVTWQPPEPATPKRRATALWVAVGSVDAAHAALAAGAAAVWLDDPTVDLWGALPPRLPALPADVWLRHPATAPVSPHLAALGLPIVAGQLGVLRAARDAGLPAIADLFLNVYSTETLLALGDLGAQAAVISLECSGREIARLAARCSAIAAPQLAVVAHGRLPAMLTRQDHGLHAGEIAAIRAVPRDGGLPYQQQRRAHDTVIWEGRRLCAPASVAVTSGLVDAWLLELGDLLPEAVTELVAAYAGLRDGSNDADAVIAIANRHAPAGLFPGHLDQGSRELDRIAGGLD